MTISTGSADKAGAHLHLAGAGRRVDDVAPHLHQEVGPPGEDAGVGRPCQ